MKIVLSGGGTGGHIFPAIAIADEIKRRDKKSTILFVGARGRMEMQRVPKAGYHIKGLWISGIQRKRSLKNLVVPLKLLISLFQAGWILMRFRPHLVMGTGGYASAPSLMMAALFRIPTLIQEQNSYSGLTNKMLSKWVDRICVAYPGMDRFFPKEKIVQTGNPVKSDLHHVHTKLEEAQRFFDSGHKKTLLMMGGSLGATSLNKAAAKGVKLFEKHKDILFIWQTGAREYEEYSKHPASKLANVKIIPFVERMDLAYALADVVICRAGAITIAELMVTGCPPVLVPSPNVAEDHQSKNAKKLAELQAAIVVPDSEVDRRLFEVALGLMNDENKRKRMQSALKKLASPQATGLIVDTGLSLISGDDKNR